MDTKKFDMQVVKQLGDLFEEMKSGYATADATISLQSKRRILFYFSLAIYSPSLVKLFNVVVLIRSSKPTRLR